MTYEAELKARLEELEALAEHVPPGVLAERLVVGISEHLERNGTIIEAKDKLCKRFAGWHVPKVVVPEPADLVEVKSLSPEEEESGEKPEGKPCMKCGEFKDFSEFGVHHLSKDGHRKICHSCATGPPPGRPISTPIANGEGEKPCADCGETKPLSEFPKNAGSKDSRRTECKSCHNLRRRAKPEGERLCANGEKCVGYKHTKRPTKLNSGNNGELCFACEERGRNNATMPTSAAISGTRGRG